jgi:hypothetical protein
MKTASGFRKGLAFGVALLPILFAGTALAAGPAPHHAQRMWLACENGRNYPLQPAAASRDYDLVTGYLLRTGRGHAVHLTLVPMGNGYRYAGLGVWFDGVRGDAVLNWDRPDAVACKVLQE